MYRRSAHPYFKDILGWKLLMLEITGSDVVRSYAAS